MKFVPPIVNYKRPIVNTFLAFLVSKGWVLDEKKGGFYLMKPPDEIKALDNPGFRYYLPCAEDSLSYDELAFHSVETFAELYDIPLQELFNLLSQDLEASRLDVQRQPKQLKMKRAMLAYAS